MSQPVHIHRRATWNYAFMLEMTDVAVVVEASGNICTENVLKSLNLPCYRMCGDVNSINGTYLYWF